MYVKRRQSWRSVVRLRIKRRQTWIGVAHLRGKHGQARRGKRHTAMWQAAMQQAPGGDMR